MSRVLVKGYEYQIGPDGKPQMYYNLSGRGRGGGGGDGPRGRTFRSKLGGRLGGAVGVMAGITGESRSLGGLAGQMFAGYQQGSAAGRGLANMATSRRRQARADILEGEKQAQAKDDAQARLAGEREMKRRRGFDRRDLSLEQIRDMGPSPNRRRILPGIGGRNMTQFGHELAAHREEQEAIAAEQAKREQKERTALERAGLGSDINALRRVRELGLSDEFLTSLEQAPAIVPTTQLAPPPVGQQPQVPQQIQPAEHGAQSQTDATVNAEGTGPNAFASHTNPSTENAEKEVQEMQGGGDEGVDSARLDRLRGMMEDENE